MRTPAQNTGSGTLSPSVELGLTAVIVAVTKGAPRVLLVRRPIDTLPGGPLDPLADATLEQGMRRWIDTLTGIEVGYIEQLYTFGNRHRDPREVHQKTRSISVGYLALTGETAPARDREAEWLSCYEILPWEDRRAGCADVIDSAIRPGLAAWTAAATDSATREDRTGRATVAFALDGQSWNAELVLERYELLYEAGLVPETARDRAALSQGFDITEASARHARTGRGRVPGLALALDHRRILATALGRLRGKIKYRPVIFELLPDSFTLTSLQKTTEALTGTILHKQNFRRLVLSGGLVEPTGQVSTTERGRPAELYRFRPEVQRDRPSPGLRMSNG